ncbi:MAG: hypothetical protein M1834_008057 [Cirrosporium novae-zelandiae]|nr:MAG: hypothetical protein M1834_008057 [Cirrosporium novae-zelandiae]
MATYEAASSRDYNHADEILRGRLRGRERGNIHIWGHAISGLPKTFAYEERLSMNSMVANIRAKDIIQRDMEVYKKPVRLSAGQFSV